MSKVKPNEAFPSMVANTAATDEFMAPDSTARRPNPSSLDDRPRTPNQTPISAVEADLVQNKLNPKE